MILLTRPLEDSLLLAKIYEEQGRSSFIEPMIFLEALTPPSIDVTSYDGIVLTSKHALPALTALSENQDKEDFPPLYCVGEKTADAAREAGFIRILDGGGSSASMKEAIKASFTPSVGNLLYLRGEIVKGRWCEKLRLQGFKIDEHIVYKAHAAIGLSPALIQLLKEKKITEIPFYSERSKEIFLSLAREAGIKITWISSKNFKSIFLGDNAKA